MTRTTPAVAATYLCPDPADDGLVYGRDVAVDGFLEALLRHGPAGEYLVLRNPDPMQGQNADAPRLAEVASGRPGVTVRTAAMAELRRGFESFPFRVWHDLDGQVQLGAALRAAHARRTYPVTATPHVLSYAVFLHDWVLRLLLQPLHPCDSLVCTSTASRVALQNLFAMVSERLGRSHGLSPRFGGRLDVIPLGVDTEVFRPRPRDEVRAALGLPRDARIVAYVGRLSVRDKADLLPLVQAFSRVRSEAGGAPVLLVVAGTGAAYAGTVRAYAAALGVADRLHLVEPVLAADRHLLHAAADVFVSPADSVQETFGITPIEAMACGVPQVVADWSGYRDTVEDGVTGFRIPARWFRADDEACRTGGVYDEYDLFDHLLLAQSVAVDVDALAGALQRLLDDDALRLRMGEASRARALACYEWRGVVGRYVELWAELERIAAREPPPARAETDYAFPAFVDVFGHYASEVLAPDARLALSDAGARVLAGEAPLPLYLEPLGLFARATLMRALALLEVGPASVATLAAHLAGEPAPRAARHAMWLLKQGLVALVRD